MTNHANPIIVALDVESAAEARALVRRLGPHVGFYKVGMELYAAAGMDVVRELLGQGKEVFLDLKFYDIPRNREARGGAGGAHRRAFPDRARGELGDARGGGGHGRARACKLLGVTVLTSFGREDLRDLGYDCDGVRAGGACARGRPWSRAWMVWSLRRSKRRGARASPARTRFW